MKIAIYADCFYPELSGVTDTVLLTGTELAKRGHEVHYFVPRYSEKDYRLVGLPPGELSLPANIKVHRMFSFRAKTATLQGRAAVPNPFRALFMRERFDIIHSQGIFGTGLDALWFAKLRRIPFIGTNHTFIEAFMQYSPIKGAWVNYLVYAYEIWYYNRAKFVSMPSEFLREDMHKKGLRTETMMLSNPVDPRFFEHANTKGELKEKLGLSPFTVLYVGRISAEKNLEVLIEAFTHFMHERGHKAELVLIGQGALRKALEERLKREGLEKHIRFVGPFLGEHKGPLFDYFHAADVFVMPSTSETQSMGVIQAMAARLPVLVARHGPLPHLVTNGRGHAFQPESAHELKDLLIRLAEHSDERTALGNEGHMFAENFSVPVIATKWETIYRNVINARELSRLRKQHQ